MIDDTGFFEEYPSGVNEVKKKKISSLCFDVCYRYKSKGPRDNPLLKNKGRLHGYFFENEPSAFPDKALTIDVIGGAG